MGPYDWGFLDGVCTIIGFQIGMNLISFIGEIIVAKIKGPRNGHGGNQAGGGGNHAGGGGNHAHAGGGGGHQGVGGNQVGGEAV
jgi:hypothetical protein